jgi:hypothetical protein
MSRAPAKCGNPATPLQPLRYPNVLHVPVWSRLRATIDARSLDCDSGCVSGCKRRCARTGRACVMRVARPVEWTSSNRARCKSGAEVQTRWTFALYCVRKAGRRKCRKASVFSSGIEKTLFFLLFTQCRKLIMIDELFRVCRTLIADLPVGELPLIKEE